jgi:mannose-6-phosphate isomerase-like protein (cupin superfamily)
VSVHHVKDAGWIISATDRPAWSDITSAGMFRVEAGSRFFRHYQDCDEYWLVCSGKAVIEEDDERYVVGPGDIIATGRGHVHDVVSVDEPLEAFWFEATMPSGGRPGHQFRSPRDAEGHTVLGVQDGDETRRR